MGQEAARSITARAAIAAEATAAAEATVAAQSTGAAGATAVAEVHAAAGATWAAGALGTVLLLLSSLTAFPTGADAAGGRPPFRVLTAQLPRPAVRVEALTCAGLAPADLVRTPQRPGTPAPSAEAPPLRTVMVVDERGRRSRVRLAGEALLVEPLGRCGPQPPIERPDQIEGSRVGVGNGVIADAWLAAATLRYRHGILGDVITAAELRATNRRGDVLRYRLPDDAVFEDRAARVVVVDGRDAVLAVRTGLTDGAALALFGFDRQAEDAGALVLLAQAEPLGRPNLWLNPAGVGDFDGSGRSGIAAVLTPHTGGTLVVYQREGAKLVERYRARGFSNHQIYSPQLGMSAVLDANGDGVADLAVPDAARRALRVVTFAAGRFAELQRIPHESEIVSAIAVQDLGRGPALVYALQDGTLVVATR